MADLNLQLGVKTDPTQYRYSYEWLFRLLAEEGITLVQLGTFFEIYQLPDEYFVQLRRQAEDVGVRISSIFTAHRELGGFFTNFIAQPTGANTRRNCDEQCDTG